MDGLGHFSHLGQVFPGSGKTIFCPWLFVSTSVSDAIPPPCDILQLLWGTMSKWVDNKCISKGRQCQSSGGGIGYESFLSSFLRLKDRCAYTDKRKWKMAMKMLLLFHIYKHIWLDLIRYKLCISHICQLIQMNQKKFWFLWVYKILFILSWN